MRLAFALLVLEKDRDDMNITIMRQTVLAIALMTMSVSAFAAETNTNGSPANDMLLLDSLGRMLDWNARFPIQLPGQVCRQKSCNGSARTRMDSSFSPTCHRCSCLTLLVRMIMAIRPSAPARFSPLFRWTGRCKVENTGFRNTVFAIRCNKPLHWSA